MKLRSKYDKLCHIRRKEINIEEIERSAREIYSEEILLK